MQRAITAAPGERSSIGIELAKLVSAFPTQDQSDASASLRVEAYFDALGSAPVWAVREARLKIIRGDALDENGKALDKRFAPTPPQFAELVRLELRPFRGDLEDLVALAAVEPYFEPTATERGFISQGFDDLRASFDKRTAHQVYEDAMAGLASRARAIGVDFDKAMDAIPDQPKSAGTFRQIKARAT